MSYVSLSKGMYMWVDVGFDIPVSPFCHLLHFIFTLPFQKILDKYGGIISATGGQSCSNVALQLLVNITSTNLNVHPKVKDFLHSFSVFFRYFYMTVISKIMKNCGAHLSLI